MNPVHEEREALGSAPEPAEFAGRVALVTGAARGIGAATARILAARGARVAVNYHKSAERAEEVVAAIRQRGGEAVAVQGDVTDPDGAAALAAAAKAELGPIDVLVLNAAGLGAHEARIAPVADLAWEDLEHVVSQQLKALFLTTQAVLPDMIARGGGSVVAVGAALARRPAPRFLPLTVAKAGVEAAVRTLALEAGPHGVRVNAVEPNLILTELARFIPEEARRAAAERAALRRNGTPRTSPRSSRSSPRTVPRTSRAAAWSPTAARRSPDRPDPLTAGGASDRSSPGLLRLYLPLCGCWLPVPRPPSASGRPERKEHTVSKTERKVVSRDDVEPVCWFGEEGRFLLRKEDTGGLYSFYQITTRPGSGPPLHVHESADEAFFVNKGTYEFEIGGVTETITEGTVIYGPRGVPHRFLNVGDEPGQLLVIATPGGVENFFIGLSELVSGGGMPDWEKMQQLANDNEMRGFMPQPGARGDVAGPPAGLHGRPGAPAGAQG